MFSETEVQQVWERGVVVPGFDADVMRKDKCGAWMKRDMYGKSNNELTYGWEINMGHLPVQWQNQFLKQGECRVTARSSENVYKG